MIRTCLQVLSPPHRKALLLCIASLAMLIGLGQSPQAQNTTKNRSENIPIDIDPQDPQASIEERKRRMRELVKMKMEQRRKREEEKKRQAASEGAGTPITAPPKDGAGDPDGKQLAKVRGKDEEPAVEDPEKKDATGPHVTFFMVPASQNVRIGREFSTACRLLNPQHLVVDRVRICLRYPTKNMRPVALHQANLKDNLRGEPEVYIDEQQGHLFYRAQFDEPRDHGEVALITVAWEALAPGDGLRIEPYFDDMATAVHSGRELISRSSFGVKEALSGATVRILDEEDEIPSGGSFLAPTLEELAPVLAGFRDQSGLRKPTLWIDQPAEGILEPGQWLVVDIGVENPDEMLFNEVRLAAKFDAQKVKVVDTDRGNWIHKGINLLDGPFHSAWPWDMHYTNAVNNRAGFLYYRMAMTNLRDQSSGPIARLFARVVEPVEAPIFTWVWNEQATINAPQTGLYLLGENVYMRGREPRPVLAQAPPSPPEPARETRKSPISVRAPAVDQHKLQAAMNEEREAAERRVEEDIDGIEKADPSWYRF